MNAAIIAVGTELLGSGKPETNSLLIARLLDRHGVETIRKSVVRDRREEIAAELLSDLGSCDVVCVTGGIGPTEDDRTVDAISSALNIPLVEDLALLERVERMFEARGMKMPAVNRKQCRVFTGHRVVPNPRGTAVGFHLNLSHAHHRRHVWIFPGVPYELEGMLEQELEPWLDAVSTRRGSQHRLIKITGLTESAVEERLRGFYQQHGADSLSVLAVEGEIHIHLTTRGAPDEGYTLLSGMEQELRALFAERVFGLDEETLESAVGRLLASRGETISTAESCTGGLLASRITDVGGSSVYFQGGIVAYSGVAKESLLGVKKETMEAHGQVSGPVAVAMAEGVRRRFGSAWGVGITGIAGPTGGTAAKPVGTVHIAVAGEGEVRERRFLLSGSRELIKRYSTQLALDMVRTMILKR